MIHIRYKKLLLSFIYTATPYTRVQLVHDSLLQLANIYSYALQIPCKYINQGQSSIHKTSSKDDDDQGPLSSATSLDHFFLDAVAADRDNARNDDSDTGGCE